MFPAQPRTRRRRKFPMNAETTKEVMEFAVAHPGRADRDTFSRVRVAGDPGVLPGLAGADLGDGGGSGGSYPARHLLAGIRVRRGGGAVLAVAGARGLGDL